MKAGVLFTGSGPILILTSYDSFTEPELIGKLKAKGINKFVARELPIDMVRERYGQHFNVTLHDLKQSDDLRVLDINGHNVFHRFSFKEMGEPIYYE